MGPRKQRTRRPVQIVADPVLLHADLAAWAGQAVARAGRRSAILGHVETLRLSEEGSGLEASVRDGAPPGYRVVVRVRAGKLVSRCGCPAASTLPCKHAVAAIEALRFPRPEPQPPRGRSGRTARGSGRVLYQPARPKGWVLTREERLALAAEQELEDRRRRARTERPSVRRISGHGGPPRFRVAGQEPEAPYTVVLRGAKAELGSCTCADFGKNELGTCKHIERARNWFLRRRKRLPRRVVSLWWRPRAWLYGPPRPLEEIRLDLVGVGASDALRAYFGAEGWLQPGDDEAATLERARAAARCAREAAERAGAFFDLDPAVEARLAEAEAALRRRQLPPLEIGDASWSCVVPRLGLKLHPYQEEGVRFLVRTGRAFLADDMGLGKTVQAIAAALLLRQLRGAKRALVVCPASLKHQWRREIERTCGEEALVLEASRETRRRAYRRWSAGFLVLNYELVVRDLPEIQRARPELVVLDEAQRIKNWETKTAKAVKRLESPYAFVLTGTPLENRLAELHSLAEFLYPRALGPRWRLFPFHAVVDPEGRVLAYEGLDVLRRRLEPFFLRRERREVLDQLPPRTENTFWTEMTGLQRRVYRRHAARVARLLAAGAALAPAQVRRVLLALTTMRILCNAYAQYAYERFEARLADPSPPTPEEIRALHSPKLEEFARVMEELLEETPAKVVVYSQWERMLRLAAFVLREALLRRGERGEVFHGGLTAGERRRILESFTEDPAFRVLFSTDAGGLGLNLQEAASVVVHLEVPWNPAVLEQRVSRVHRPGQRRSVQVLHFLTRDAIEERVRQIVEEKRALFEGLLVEEADRVVLAPRQQATLVERLQQLLRGEPNVAERRVARRGAGG